MARYVDIEPYKACKIVLHSEDKGFPVSDIPTADVQEIRRGKWVEDNDGVTRCSNCGAKANRNFYVNVQELSDYCPECGSKMDGDEE